jgi:hypothetical protein
MLSSEFRTLINEHGLREALRRLNVESPYRYSAVFAFEGDLLRCVCFIDKHQADAVCEDQPVTQSYCVYVRQSRKTFSVENAACDGRVAGHPKSKLLYCYYGVPLISVNGDLLGTLCHFDERPIPVTPQVADALDNVAPIITQVVFPAAHKSR